MGAIAPIIYMAMAVFGGKKLYHWYREKVTGRMLN